MDDGVNKLQLYPEIMTEKGFLKLLTKKPPEQKDSRNKGHVLGVGVITKGHLWVNFIAALARLASFAPEFPLVPVMATAHSAKRTHLLVLFISRK